MFKIYWADLGRALNIPEIGIRPVVSVCRDKDTVKCYRITSRNKSGLSKYYAHMNNYIIHGYCDCAQILNIDKRFLMDYVRDCTTSEVNEISRKVRENQIRESRKEHEGSKSADRTSA